MPRWKKLKTPGESRKKKEKKKRKEKEKEKKEKNMANKGNGWVHV